MMEWLGTLLVFFLAFLIGSLPLHLAAKALSADTSIFKTILVNVIAGVVAALVAAFVPFFATIAAFIALLFVYKFAFRIGWLRSLAVWVLQIIISGLFLLLATILGIFSITGVSLASLL